MNKTILCMLYALFHCFGCSLKQPEPSSSVNSYSVFAVPDEGEAKKIALESWLSLYGESVLVDTPFVCQLKDSIWIVEGTLNGNKKGGAPYIEIGRYDGRIYMVSHSK
ncbi:MAG TPA: NTF2 fold immunity protein [Saprospiraceae bacterium]|nr:NTF2 fold immunity protein [Saprospiraceae bacterium]